MKCLSRKLVRPQWLSLFLLAKLAYAIYELDDNHERRLNTNFYAIDKTSQPRVEITTIFDPSDEENDFPQDEYIHSQMVAADAAQVENDNLATEKSIGVRLKIGSKPLVFDATPGPSELSAILEPFQYDITDGTIPRSNSFWYGELRDDDDFFDQEQNPDERKLREKKKPRQKKEGSFKASMNLLKYQSEDSKIHFVSGSITTKDEVYDISIFPNGTTAIESTKWEDFPGHEDHDPPNTYDVHTAVHEHEGNHRFLRSVAGNKANEQFSKEIKGNFHSSTSSGHQEQRLLQALNADNKVQIDVLVMYTQRAMCAQKYLSSDCEDTLVNRAAIEARIDLAIRESNTAFLSSEVFVTLNLKHKVLAAGYNDNVNFGQILTEFKENGDGKLDEVHILREKHYADLAVLVVENPTYCGLGYMYNGNKEYGFSVTSRKCMTGYYSFVHELSHNMGCNHNREASSTQFDYSHAYLDPNGQFRTIMGYNCKGGCPRINRFSNPHTTYNGKKVGGDKENNALQVNSVAQIVADWYREDESFAGIIEPTKNPTPSPTEAKLNKNFNTPTKTVECPPKDPFGIAILYETDEAEKANDWISDFPSNASYDRISAKDHRLEIKTYGEVKTMKSDEIRLQGPTTLAISKASNQQGFQNTELTAYMKWINDGKFVYESKAVFTSRSEALDIEAKGCNGQSYGAIVDRLTGEVKFIKLYYKQSFKEVTSDTVVVKPPELQGGRVLNSYVGFKFVVYTVDAFNVKLELYVDLSDGESGGDWKLVHEILDRPNAWKAVQLNWHYNYFIRSQCQKTDGEPLLGHRKYEKISVDVSRDAEVAVKNISIRNISVEKKAQHDQMCNQQLQTRKVPAPTEKPTVNPTKHPTARPTRKPTQYPTARPTRKITSSPTRDNTKPIFTSRTRQSYFQNLGNSQSNENKSNVNLVFSFARNDPTASPTEEPQPKLRLSFNTVTSPSNTESQETSNTAENGKKLNLKFNSASNNAGGNEKCDAFGLNIIYESDDAKKEDDWDSDVEGVVRLDQYSPTSKQEDRLHQVHYGTIKLEKEEAIFTRQAQLFVRTKNKDANEGFRSIEVTGYGNYYRDGTMYEDSGLTMIAHSTYGEFDPCKKAAYTATVTRKTGEAVFNKIYWAQTWRVVKAVPIKIPIEEFRGKLPTNQWIGMKFVVLDERGGKVKLQLFLDLTQGRGGGDWKLVLEMEDEDGKWMADESATYYKYYKYSKCGDDDGKPFTGPTRYTGITVYGSSDTEVRWKNFSIRNVSRNRVTNDRSCPFVWKD